MKTLKMKRLMHTQHVCEWEIPAGDFLYVNEEKDIVAWIEHTPKYIDGLGYAMLVHGMYGEEFVVHKNRWGIFSPSMHNTYYMMAEPCPYILAWTVWALSNGMHNVA